MLQVLDASQDRFPAARQRGLFPEPVRGRCNSPLELLFDQFCLRRGDPWCQSSAGHRLVQQGLGHLCLSVAQENNEIVMVAGKGIGAIGRNLEFLPSGLPDLEPLTIPGDSEHAVCSELVPADV